MTREFLTIPSDPSGRGAPSAAPAFVRRAGAILLFLAALLCAGLALAYDFPPLTGRIVDAANVIPDATKAALEPKLQTLEEKSGIQLVVATVNSLDGDEIEPYANALFRDWKLGEKDKNNGVLLLIAPNQHRVRIEVGYGLEGTLTDALSKIIISNAMAPRFKAGDYGGGVERGVDDIITVLTTDASEWQKRPDLRLDHRDSATDSLTPWIVLALFVVIVILLTRAPRVGAQAGYSTGDPRWGKGALQERAPAERDYFWSNLLSFILGMLANSGGRGGGWGDGGGFGGGGGFSGGGGSSGGGGASGSW
ncbi:MAG: TPM domain-containing protein [Methylocella sp.]